MANLLYQQQFFTTTMQVVGGIDSSQTDSIVIQSISGLDTTKPGIALLEYSDPLIGDYEWIEYASINSTTKEFQGVTRGAEGSTGKSHDNGVTVAFPVSESHVNRINEKLNGNDTLDNDLDLGATTNIQVDGSDPYRTIVLAAPAWKPTTTGGCAIITTVEAGTNDIDYQVLDFDDSTQEKAFINFNMPDSWDGGTITARFVWTAASGSGDVVWGLQGRAYANDDAIDQALGTAQTVTDTLTAAGDVCISSATSAITLAGSPAGGQMVHLRVYRDASAGGDTLAADARLIALQIEYQQGQFGD